MCSDCSSISAGELVAYQTCGFLRADKVGIMAASIAAGSR